MSQTRSKAEIYRDAREELEELNPSHVLVGSHARAWRHPTERWSIIVMRNIIILGCRTFNEIADSSPGLSRGLLSRRLRELERAGVLEIHPKSDGPGSVYEPTEAGSNSRA